MKSALFGLLLTWCGSTEHRAPAGARSAARMCGDTRCAASEICVEQSIGQGTASADGTAHTHVTFSCAAEPRATDGAFACSEVRAHRQQCTAMVPSAPPAR